MRLVSILLVILISILLMLPVIAIDSYHQFPTPDGKYLTVEVNGNLVELWIRENPNSCSYGDKFLGSLNPDALSTYCTQNPSGYASYTSAEKDDDNVKKTLDAVSLAIEIGECSFWIGAAGASAGAVGVTYGATLTGVGILPAVVAIPFESIAFLYSTGEAAMSCSQAAGDLILYINPVSVGGRQVDPSESQFLVTSGTYSETTDLDQAVKNEFGNDYCVADWTDIMAHSDDIQNWANRIGMNHGDYYFVTLNGQGFWDGGNRHYFITRFDGAVDSGYLVHDQIDSNFITLGSWYGIQERILAIKTSNTMPSAVSAQSTETPTSSNQVLWPTTSTY